MSSMSDLWKSPSGELILNLDHVTSVELQYGEARIKTTGPGYAAVLVQDDKEAFLSAVAARAIEQYQVKASSDDMTLYTPGLGVIPVATLSSDAAPVVKSLYNKLVRLGFGVTLQGTHLTVRWRDDEPKSGYTRRLLQVTMIIDEVDDGRDDGLEGGT